MKITPLDIKKQDFSQTFRGYDKEEVDTFLDMIAREWEDLIKSRQSDDQELIALRDQIKKYAEMEDTLKKSLMNAVKMSEHSKVQAEKEAELIIKEAKINAEEEKAKVIDDLRNLKEELKAMREQKRAFIIRAKNLLRGQIEMLSEMEYDDRVEKANDLEEMPPMSDSVAEDRNSRDKNA